jgi:lipopolysaccharide biosynthesis glycosyltransferase
VRTLVGKILRRIEWRLHAIQVRLLRNDPLTKAQALETARVRRLRLLYERSRLLSGVVPGAYDEWGAPATPTVAHQKILERDITMWGREDAFFRAFLEGRTFDEAVMAAVQALIGRPAGQVSLRRARSFAQALYAQPDTRQIGAVASAAVMAHDHMPATAWEHFESVPREYAIRHAPGAYFTAGLVLDPQRAAADLRDVIEGRIEVETSAEQWLGIARSSFVTDQEDLSRAALDRAAALVGDEHTTLKREIDWLYRWYGRREAARGPVECPPGTIPFAVLDYKQPDREFSSKNLGDHVQTIASLGHLVRHQRFDFTGDPELAKVADQLQSRVRDDRQISTTPSATFSLYRCDRDATNYFPIPEGTWAFAFGWFMHPIFRTVFDAPLNPRLRPIFISVHVNEPAMLSDEMIQYLRKYAPVGCRDWNTVHLLLAAGVPAFFSGCLTTTIDTVFAPKGHGRGKGTLWVDLDNPGDGDRFGQVFDEVRERSFSANVDDALDRLESYRSKYAHVVTSRLHCYLPARSIGADVEFRPKNPADVRFDGLAHIGDSAYDAIRNGILDKLATVTAAIAEGRDEEQVYALWREICAPEVAKAEELRASLADIAEPTFDVAAACAVIHERSVVVERSEPGPAGEEVAVEFSLDGNLKDQFNVVLESIVDNASRPIRLYVLCRDHSTEDFERAAQAFPTVSFVWLPTDDVDYGSIIGMISHITVATMDRLLLPELLPDLNTIIHHDLDALCLGDIAELADLDVADARLAARTSPQPASATGFGVLIRASSRIRNNRARARELVLRTHTRHTYDFKGFNAGVMVLNLERMRSEGFCRHFLPYAERFGLNDQEILNAYAGANRVELDPDWNRFPRLEVVKDPKIVHWAGYQKPWGPEFVQYQHQWDEYERKFRERQSLNVSDVVSSDA